jgi:hypothetical protein
LFLLVFVINWIGFGRVEDRPAPLEINCPVGMATDERTVGFKKGWEESPNTTGRDAA